VFLKKKKEPTQEKYDIKMGLGLKLLFNWIKKKRKKKKKRKRKKKMQKNLKFL
jgi:hypothetical protein